MKTTKPMCRWNDILECWERIPTGKEYQTTFNGELLEDKDIAFIKKFGGFNSSEHMRSS